jgi:hypothetical protein
MARQTSTPLGKTDIHQYHTRLKVAGFNYGIRDGKRFPDHADTVLSTQHGLQSHSNDFVIVHDQHAGCAYLQPAHAHRYASLLGFGKTETGALHSAMRIMEARREPSSACSPHCSTAISLMRKHNPVCRLWQYVYSALHYTGMIARIEFIYSASADIICITYIHSIVYTHRNNRASHPSVLFTWSVSCAWVNETN